MWLTCDWLYTYSISIIRNEYMPAEESRMQTFMCQLHSLSLSAGFIVKSIKRWSQFKTFELRYSTTTTSALVAVQPFRQISHCRVNSTKTHSRRRSLLIFSYSASTRCHGIFCNFSPYVFSCLDAPFLPKIHSFPFILVCWVCERNKRLGRERARKKKKGFTRGQMRA
jgi:hypothetical protein